MPTWQIPHLTLLILLSAREHLVTVMASARATMPTSQPPAGPTLSVYPEPSLPASISTVLQVRSPEYVDNRGVFINLYARAK